jgi:hypothetical protein
MLGVRTNLIHYAKRQSESVVTVKNESTLSPFLYVSYAAFMIRELADTPSTVTD